jgi:mRNA interferase MazF
MVTRFEIYLVNLDPTQGSEIRKTRPAVVVSPNEMNTHLQTVIIAPMTTKGRPYPTRIPIRFQRRSGQVVADQIRTIDKSRLVKRIGRLKDSDGTSVLALLREMFAA